MAREGEVRLTDEEIKKFQAKSLKDVEKANVNQSTIRRISRRKRQIKAVIKGT